MRFRLLALMLVAMTLAFACGRPESPVVIVPPPSTVATLSRPPKPAPDPTPAAPAIVAMDGGLPPAIRMRFRGVNLSGAEFAGTASPPAIPGVMGRDYKWPSPKDADFFLDRGMNHFRVLFRHERMQPKLQGPLADTEIAPMLALVNHVTARGGTVALAPHNSFRHGVGCAAQQPADPKCHVLTEIEIGDFWGRVAKLVASNPRVQINLTNEPHDMTSEQVVALDNAAIKEIRRVGFTGVVLAPGNGWTGGGHWTASWYGTPNAKAMLGVNDPGSNVVFEIHQYLDANADGLSDCVSPTIGVERIAPFVLWLRANGRTGWLGEIAGRDTPTCREAVARALTFVEANYDVFAGWDAWGAGVWSYGTSYPLSLGPSSPPKPLLAWYTAFVPCASITSADAGVDASR